MDIAGLYRTLPEPLRPPAKSLYHRFVQQPDDVSDAFVEEFFDSKATYGSLAETGVEKLKPIVEDAVSDYSSRVPESGPESWAGVTVGRAAAYYAFVRARQPDTVVETGVCNGVSSLALLLAMDENDTGQLYSVDYPVYADSELPDVVARVKESGDTFSAVPSDKSPGWVVPDSLRGRWELTLGRSQRELPGVLETAGEVDLFIHDSEHTFPCMMFEYELAWEWLADGGVLISDDVHANEAFETFTEIRAGRSGPFGSRSGFAVR